MKIGSLRWASITFQLHVTSNMFASHNYFYRLHGKVNCTTLVRHSHKWNNAHLQRNSYTKGVFAYRGISRKPHQPTHLTVVEAVGWWEPTHNTATPYLLNVTSGLPYIIIANSPPVTTTSPLTPNSPLPLPHPLLPGELCFLMWRRGFPFFFIDVLT